MWNFLGLLFVVSLVLAAPTDTSEADVAASEDTPTMVDGDVVVEPIEHPDVIMKPVKRSTDEEEEQPQYLDNDLLTEVKRKKREEQPVADDKDVVDGEETPDEQTEEQIANDNETEKRTPDEQTEEETEVDSERKERLPDEQTEDEIAGDSERVKRRSSRHSKKGKG